MELLFNEDSEDDLMPESDSSESSISEMPESPEIALISDVGDETTPETSPGYCPPLQSFTANTGLNTAVHNTDVKPLVNLYVANSFLEYVCEQTNLYASQVIGAAPRPFTEHSKFQVWTPVTLPELKKN
jgi:hypothetical protein